MNSSRDRLTAKLYQREMEGWENFRRKETQHYHRRSRPTPEQFSTLIGEFFLHERAVDSHRIPRYCATPSMCSPAGDPQWGKSILDLFAVQFGIMHLCPHSAVHRQLALSHLHFLCPQYTVLWPALGGLRRIAMTGFLVWIIVGLIAGWLAGQVMKGGGYGILMDIVLGILGGLLGGWIFNMLGLWQGRGMIGSVIVAFIGAVILVWITRLIKRA